MQNFAEGMKVVWLCSCPQCAIMHRKAGDIGTITYVDPDDSEHLEYHKDGLPEGLDCSCYPWEVGIIRYERNSP